MNTGGESRGTTFLMASACGVIVANLYYAQTLVGPIATELGMTPEFQGLIVTMSQVGYCAGLLLLAPLADITENRRLVVSMTFACATALAILAFSQTAAVFLLMSLLVGMASVAVQVLVPMAAHMAADDRRGRVVGTVMSGLMIGIMLARPVASAIADFFSWRATFGFSTLIMLVCGVVLGIRLPRRQPTEGMSYGGLLSSMIRLYRYTPVLQQRGLYQALLFGAFSLFWTAAPLYLTSPVYSLTQGQIALFSLVGVAGAVAAPIGGALADHGKLRAVTVGSMLLMAVSFLATHLGEAGGIANLLVLVAAAVGIDFAVTANLVVSQREIFGLKPELRSRLNALFIATFFVGGAVGSAVGGWSYAKGGWSLTTTLGMVLPLLGLVVFLLFDVLPARAASRP